MSPELWKENVFEAIDYIADRNFQKKALLGDKSLCFSIVEAYCGLFDDADFENFLDLPNYIKITQNQKKLGYKLIEKMNEYSEVFDEFPDIQVLDHPKWIEIRQAAKEFLESFNKPKF